MKSIILYCVLALLALMPIATAFDISELNLSDEEIDAYLEQVGGDIEQEKILDKLRDLNQTYRDDIEEYETLLIEQGLSFEEMYEDLEKELGDINLSELNMSQINFDELNISEDDLALIESFYDETYSGDAQISTFNISQINGENVNESVEIEFHSAMNNLEIRIEGALLDDQNSTYQAFLDDVEVPINDFGSVNISSIELEEREYEFELVKNNEEGEFESSDLIKINFVEREGGFLSNIIDSFFSLFR